MAWGDIASRTAIGVSVILGGWGVRRASHANRHSAKALELARAADERADRAERLQLERRVVQWERGFVLGRDVHWAENVGTD